jgi:hypothetical protein
MSMRNAVRGALVAAVLVLGSFATGTGGAAAAPTLESSCAKEILQAPKVIALDVLHSGRVNQDIQASLEFAPVSSECDGKYERLGYLKPEIQQPSRGRRWWSEDGPGWPDLCAEGNEGGLGGKNSLNSYRKPVMYVKPDSKLRFRLRVQVVRPSGRVLRTKISIHPVKNPL